MNKEIDDIKREPIEIVVFALGVFIICLIIYIIYPDSQMIDSNTTEGMINIPLVDKDSNSWNRTANCKFTIGDTTTRVLKESNIPNDNTQNSALIFPCGYNNINDEIKMLPNVYNKNPVQKRVFIIDGANEITAKNYMWKNMLNHHGFRKVLSLAPNTYLLYGQQKTSDIERLKKDHYDGKMYIMKKNIQRQNGIKITDNISEIINNHEKYILVQELVQNSFLVNGYKINLRVYVVVICHKNQTNVYMFNNGFMYYTKRKFVKGLRDSENHITTGYVERDVYYKNPLTHDDFKRYLDMNSGERYHQTNNPKILTLNESSIRSQGLKVSDIVFNRIEKLLADVFISFKGYICNKVSSDGKDLHIYNDYSVQIFGADVAIDDQLQPMIIEVNKGPDLSPKDDRDGVVKRKMMNDVLEKIGMKKMSNSNGLKLVLDM